MTKKNLWLYKITKVKWFYDDNIEHDSWNFFVYRSLSQYKKHALLAFDCEELRKNSIKIKRLPKQEVELRDPYVNEKSAAAFNEKKCWKRNSKRKHQWKDNYSSNS